MYRLDDDGQWTRMTGCVEGGARLGVCGERVVAVGGWKGNVLNRKVMVWRGERQTFISDMLVGCWLSCIVSVGGGDLLVMGGEGYGDRVFRCLMVRHRPGTMDHRFLRHVKPCQQWSMGT